MRWWRKPFFFEVSGTSAAEPLLVNWPAGEVVFSISMFVGMTVWMSDMQIMGLSSYETIKLGGVFTVPPRCLHWPGAPEHAVISSVTIDGVEQIAQAKSIEEIKNHRKFGIHAVVFRPRPYTLEVRRRWWGWLPKLWERDDEDGSYE